MPLRARDRLANSRRNVINLKVAIKKQIDNTTINLKVAIKTKQYDDNYKTNADNKSARGSVLEYVTFVSFGFRFKLVTFSFRKVRFCSAALEWQNREAYSFFRIDGACRVYR